MSFAIYKQLKSNNPTASLEYVRRESNFFDAVRFIDDRKDKDIYEYSSPQLVPFTGKEEGRLIMQKTVGGHEFKLWLVAIPCDEYRFITGYDYMIDGPNWCSGHLKAHGYNEEEIFTYFDNCSIEDVKSAHEAANERSYFSAYGD
jgi:hypothetical protein